MLLARVQSRVQAPSGSRRVLVAGTGRYDLSDVELWIATAVGQMLAQAGHRLVTGGWSGVDHVVSREFAAIIRSLGKNVGDHLTQIVSTTREPDFADGEIMRVQAGDAEFDEELRRADAVVLIGGLGGTYRIFQHALQRDIPILPLPASGGDALRAFNLLTEPSERADVFGPLLRQLMLEIRSAEDASKLANRLRALLDGPAFTAREQIS
jgi:hypothetical protein